MVAATQVRLQAEAAAWCCDVWPENWHAVQLFVALATQWHWASAGLAGSRRTGLRYSAIRPVLPMVQQAVQQRWRQPYPTLMRQLQHMEDEALKAMSAAAGSA